MNSFSRTLSCEKSLESLSGDLSSYGDHSHDLNETVSELFFSFSFPFFVIFLSFTF